MNKEHYIVLISLSVVITATLVVIFAPKVDAQLRYNLDNPVVHVKFLTSNSTDDLSFQFNKFIVNKTFDSRVFELIDIEVIEFDTLNNNYSMMITYKNLNEESPDRALADLQERLLLAQKEELPIE